MTDKEWKDSNNRAWAKFPIWFPALVIVLQLVLIYFDGFNEMFLMRFIMLVVSIMVIPHILFCREKYKN